MSKTLVLVRHAHRDTTHRELDNGLSEKGKEQAKSLRRFLGERFKVADFRKGLWFVSSPKLRCVETLNPMAKLLEKSVDIHPDLDEQTGKETGAQFEQRIRRFLQEWKQGGPEFTILCSHGDWLPLATFQLLGIVQDFKKGAWLELEFEGTTPFVRWYVPSFKYFYR